MFSDKRKAGFLGAQGGSYPVDLLYKVGEVGIFMFG